MSNQKQLHVFNHVGKLGNLKLVTCDGCDVDPNNCHRDWCRTSKAAPWFGENRGFVWRARKRRRDSSVVFWLVVLMMLDAKMKGKCRERGLRSDGDEGAGDGRKAAERTNQGQKTEEQSG